jgi:hypothetical protein
LSSPPVPLSVPERGDARSDDTRTH